jgi:diacylglycerol kinase family enzyme
MDESQSRSSSSAAARWLARLAILAAAAAFLLILVGGIKSIAVLLLGVLAFAATLAGIWWFLSGRGVLRWLGAVVAVGAPVAAVVLYIARQLFLVVAVVVALGVVAIVAAREALLRITPKPHIPERTTPPPRHPFLIMNPRSGGGKVARFQLDSKAAALGADVALIEGPGPVDVAAMARAAVAAGADLLGVAGGDGTQALVAGIASEHDLPFLVISAGTRNHFAMDLGLDRDHPDRCLEALSDGVEVDLDLGVIGGRTFVNNASFGAYAEIVQSPAYRDNKRGTTLQMLPDLLTARGGPHLRVTIDGGDPIDRPEAVLISNNPYETSFPGEMGRRLRIDRGVLGVITITVDSAAGAAGLVRVRTHSGVRVGTAREVVIDADVDEIPVGIDGEAVLMPTPVRCVIRPHALRVRVPRHRPGLPTPPPAADVAMLRSLAFGHGTVPRPDGAAPPPPP